MKTYKILNLGAGVQSTAIYLWMTDGIIEPVDYAIFADTQEEPEAVYRHLDWLKRQPGPQILVRTAGKLGDDLLQIENGTRQRFASVPFFTKDDSGHLGMTRRQCTSEYKVAVVEKTIRREIVGLKYRQKWPKKEVEVVQFFGISLDEAGRSSRVRERVLKEAHSTPRFPLLEDKILGRQGWTRWELQAWLEPRVPHKVPRSACVFCPFRGNSEWDNMQKNYPEDFYRAVQIDDGLRVDGAIVNRNMKSRMYVHRSCVPLSKVQFSNPDQRNLFNNECEGLCGV